MGNSVLPTKELVLRAIEALGMEGGAVVVEDIQKMADQAQAAGVVTKTEGNTSVTNADVPASEILERMTKTIEDLSVKVSEQAGQIAAQAETIAKVLKDFSALQEVAKKSSDDFARVTKSIGEVREILSGAVTAPAPEPEPPTDTQKEILNKTSRKLDPVGKGKFSISPSGAVIYPRD